ncbi:hypothetical protein PYCC9005_000877 [Savitreella phatthalungensis]
MGSNVSALRTRRRAPHASSPDTANRFPDSSNRLRTFLRTAGRRARAGNAEPLMLQAEGATRLAQLLAVAASTTAATLLTQGRSHDGADERILDETDGSGRLAFTTFVSQLREGNLADAMVISAARSGDDRRTNVFRIFRFAPVEHTTESAAGIPVLLVGMHAVDADVSAELAERAASRVDSRLNFQDLDPDRPQESDQRPAISARRSTADAFEVPLEHLEPLTPQSDQSTTMRHAQQNWLIYVLGGIYPPGHPLISLSVSDIEAVSYLDLLALLQLLGNDKTGKVRQTDLYMAGQEIIIGEGAEHDNCAVCLETVDAGQVCRKLDPCGHEFHKGCVDSWLSTARNSCPSCRTPTNAYAQVDE